MPAASPWWPWLAGASTALLALLLTPLVRAVAVQLGAVDRPSSDRWGRRVVARLGGVSVFLSCLAATAVFLGPRPVFLGLWLGLGAIFAVGLADDLHRLKPYTKLLWQIAIGCLLVMLGVRIELIERSWVAVPVSIFWFVLMINAFNLLDNMDGLAAGIGVVAAAFCSFHAALAGDAAVATMAAIVSGACLGFLRYNFPPAKIYMGDSGSHLLGLSLSALALLGTWRHSTQLVSIMAVPVLVLAVPIFDTCFVTIQRVANRLHPFQGGRDHVSHRLAVLGLSQRQTVLVLYAVSVAFGALSLLVAHLHVLSAAAVWLAALAVVLVAGAYLARVRVYEVRDAAAAPATLHPPAGTTPIATMLMHKRRIVEVLVDVALVVSAYVTAHLLRFEAVLTADLQALIMRSLPLLILIKLACFAGAGLYRGAWRYVGLPDLVMIAKAVTVGSILSALTLLYLWRFEGYSRAVFIIDWMLSLLAVGGSRVAERLLDQWIRSAMPTGPAAIIVGAGDTGARVLHYLRSEGRAGQRIIGFLDDDVRKHGLRIQGLPILGSRARLPELLGAEQVREVLVAITDPPGELLQYIQRCCEPCGAGWRVVTAGVTTAE